MAITVVQHNAVGASDTVTFSATGSGNLLICFPLVVGASITGVSDGTNSFEQFPSARVDWAGTFSGVQTDVYFLRSSTSGKTSATVTASGASFIEMQFWEVSGLTSVATDGKADNGTAGGTSAGDGTCTGPTIVTTGTSGFVVAICGVAGGGISQNPKTGNAFTSGGDTPGSDGYVSLITSASGSYTPVWLDSSSSDPFLASVVAFKIPTPLGLPFPSQSSAMRSLLTW